MNNTITEKKNTLVGINSRINKAEEQISDLEERMVKITTTEQNQEKRMKRREDTLRGLWDNIKSTNIRNAVSPLHMNFQVANFQRCEHASGSTKEPEPVPSMSGMSETAAYPPSPIADNPSDLPSPTSSPSSSQ